jgi:hypothetical protein
VDKADRSAATVRKASRIGCRMASCCAKSQRFLLARDIGEGQRLRVSITSVLSRSPLTATAYAAAVKAANSAASLATMSVMSLGLRSIDTLRSTTDTATTSTHTV